MKEKDLKNESRRSFFRRAGLGLGAAGLATSGLVGEGKAALPSETGKSAGYRETAHVKTYYKLAKF